MRGLLLGLLIAAVLCLQLARASEIKRERLISQAIKEVHAEELQVEKADVQRKGGHTTSEDLLQAFKHASKEAVRQGKARVKFEKIIRRAERNILNDEKRQMELKASTQEKAEEIAKVLLHRPGSVLTEQEVARVYMETECEEKPINCNKPAMRNVRTVTGVCNNLQEPRLGSADTPFKRLIPAQYEDGFNQLRGTMQSEGSSLVGEGPFEPPNPSPRIVSVTVIRDEPILNDDLSHILMQWGQFMDHDLDLAPAFREPPCMGCNITEQCVPIRIPDGDPAFPGQCNPFQRSIPACDPEAKHGKVRPREQLNELTAFIDASQVYGSSEEIFNAVRDGKTAFLKTGPNIPSNGGASLPIDTNHPELVECMTDQPCFLAGDVRVNEQLSLTIMHTIWMREHNRIARELLRSSPSANPESVFQTARAIVGAELQKITLMDYLPILLGRDNMESLIGSYKQYNPKLNPSIPNAFATAAFRFGHSQINPVFNRLNENNQPLDIGPLNLVDAFFNPQQYTLSGGTDPILRGLLMMPARKVDEFVNDVLTNHLFQTTESVGMDLAALNIQRGRDHGLPPYLTWKRWAEERCNLSSNFRSDLTTVRLLQTYGTLDTVDLWVGGLSEERIPGGLLGATFSCIFAKTFQAVRDGDRFYYESPGSGFTEEQRASINQVSLSRVICDNSDGITEIQRNAFRADQEPIPCDRLDSINLDLWRDSLEEDSFCYLRVSVNGMRGTTVQSVSRRGSERKRFETDTSRSSDRLCLPIVCPSSPFRRTRASVFTDNRRCMVSSNRELSRSSGRTFRARISTRDIRDSSTGAYSSLQSCESGSAVAATFNCRGDVAAIESDEKLLQDLESTLTQISESTKSTVKSQQTGKVVEIPVDAPDMPMPKEVADFINEEDGDSEDDEKNTNAQNSDGSWKDKTINVLEDLLHTLKDAKRDSEQKDATDQELYDNLSKLLKET